MTLGVFERDAKRRNDLQAFHRQVGFRQASDHPVQDQRIQPELRSVKRKGSAARRYRNRDFLDTAAIMKNLDLVITADTATAHLEGALAESRKLTAASLVDRHGHWSALRKVQVYAKLYGLAGEA